MKQDPSINRLKIKGLLLTLRADRLVHRTADGWAATYDGARVLDEIAGVYR